MQPPKAAASSTAAPGFSALNGVPLFAFRSLRCALRKVSPQDAGVGTVPARPECTRTGEQDQEPPRKAGTPSACRLGKACAEV